MKRIFVVGPPRSGSTLCQQLIAASDQILTIPETHFFTSINNDKSHFRTLKNLRCLRNLRKIARSSNFRSQPAFFNNQESAINAFREWLDRETKAENKTGWLEKTPSHLYHVLKIKQNFESPLFVFTRRSAFENISSLNDVAHLWHDQIDQQGLGYSAARWYFDTVLSEVRAKELGGHIFDYDELMEDPENTVKKLYSFLGLPNADQVLKKDLSLYSDKIITKQEHWKKNNRKPQIKKSSRYLDANDLEILAQIREALKEKSK